MKIQNLLTLTACVAFLGNPVARSFAADATPSPSPMKKVEKPMDPDREKWQAARKKAQADPEVKAAFDTANKLALEKMREIDPSLGPKIDKEEEKMKPKAPKAAKETEKSTTASPTPAGAN